ncbi:MAG: DUF2322 family protein [Hydrogenophilales bacterium]|nr:DUF2322 family protein [Hydrogenophilales bacterium]
MGFQDNLAVLAPADHLVRVELVSPEGVLELIENRPGSQGSVRVYQHLASKYGEINTEAAAEGLALYAEHGEEARLNPGRHPNIDRLLRVLANDQRLAVRLVENLPAA